MNRLEVPGLRSKIWPKIALLCLLLLSAACGKKGPLIPPEALVPAPISDLRVTQKGESIQVSWSRPVREQGGGALRDLAGFRVLKREVLPPAEDCEQCPDAYRIIRNVDLEYLRDVARQGNLFLFSDRDIGREKTYQYKVLSVNREGAESRDSNRVRLKYAAPPAPPRLHGRFTPAAAVLEWESGALPSGISHVGYNIYRRKAGGMISVNPLNEKPLTEARFEDRQLDRDAEYGYIVRAVSRVGNESAESEPSNEVVGKLAPPDRDDFL